MVSGDSEDPVLAVITHRKMFHGYIVTCKPTGKQYIGITGGPVDRRWRWHLTDSRRRTGSALWAAIRKYGDSAFSIESVLCARNLADILQCERSLITQHGTFAPAGYNLTLGGEGRFGFKPSAESVERSAAKHRGKACHPNTRKAASEFHKGRKKSEATRLKIAASRKGIPRSSETKAKLAAYWAARRVAGEFKTPKVYGHSRKAASAAIAKIPLSLARHIAATYLPMVLA